MRQIYIVNATQVVTSENHPEGLFSVMSGYPKNYDSRNYGATEANPDGNPEKAFQAAEAEYLGKVSSILAADNPTRAMATVTLERADGKSVYHRCLGGFPNVTPEPEPEEAGE